MGEQISIDLNNVLERIIKIPSEIYTKGNISLYELFINSGYCDCNNYITEDEIKNYLLKYKNYTKDWANYSENKRVDKGYYFILKNGKYIIGYYNKNKIDNRDNIVKTYNLSEEIDACANFIKLELEDLRKNE